MLSRLQLGLVTACIAAFHAGTAQAYCTSYPNSFSIGEIADPNQVNANFGCAALTSGSTIESLISTNGEYFTHESDSFVNSDNVIGLHSNNFLYLEGNSNGGLWLSDGYNRYDSVVLRNSTHEIDFITNANNTNPALVINSSGNIGMGVSSPTYKLTVNSQGNTSAVGADIHAQYYGPLMETEQTSASYFAFGVANGAAHNSPGSWGSMLFYVRADGNVGIDTTTPSYTLHVNGSVAGTSAYNNLSDVRLKKDIAPIRDALSIVASLNGIRYRWRTPKERTVGKAFRLPVDEPQIGFVAQDLKKVLPEAVSVANGRDAIMSVAESKVVPVLVEALKELKVQNDEQARKIEVLRAQQTSQINHMRSELAEIQRRLAVRTARN